jgi:hypothetical protein
MPSVKAAAKLALRPARPATIRAERLLQRVNRATALPAANALPGANVPVPAFTDIESIRAATLNFIADLRVTQSNRFIGYRFTRSGRQPLLYSTLAALLVKHLYDAVDTRAEEELELVCSYQDVDGLFRDPAIACPIAESSHWWGWTHLTLHALMTLALFRRSAPMHLRAIEPFFDGESLRRYLDSRDWSTDAAMTSNELQNLGVMLQYARDFQETTSAGLALQALYRAIAERQDPVVGLHGGAFQTQYDFSQGVQASYHFWLLTAYDGLPIPHAARVARSTVSTQNIRGGFSTQWNSSACEDIDSVDILVRLLFQDPSLASEIRPCLHRALPAILGNLNGDGSWVFRRDEALTLPHPTMCSQANEGNLFYTWFRTLGLALCLLGLGPECPPHLGFGWQLERAPGLQLNPMFQPHDGAKPIGALRQQR